MQGQNQNQQQRQITDAELPDKPSARQVAAWLGKSLNTIYAWCEAGEIPHRKAGRSKIFDKQTLLAWARNQEQ